MSKKQIKELKDLKDSALLYDKTLPSFGYIILSVITLLLVAVIIWSIKTPKMYVIKSNGVIESDNKNYIMSSYTGEIKEMYIQEGSYVEDGDLLFTVKSTDLDLQKEQIEGQLKVYKEKINGLQKLEKAIMDGENYFDINIEEERPYYNQYETYLSQIGQNKVDASTYKSYGYSDEQIEAELKKNSAKVSEIYYSTLKSINDSSIRQYEDEAKKMEIQGGAIESGQSEYNVLANTSGIVHMMNNYKSGMVVQAGSAIGSIANENDKYLVNAYLSVSDMPRTKVGDSVEIEVSGLMQSIYGTIPGEIQYIDSDMTSSQDGKETYFKAKIALDNAYLVSTKGNKVNISNGMSVEARIKYDEITYFNYVMEALGVLTR